MRNNYKAAMDDWTEIRESVGPYEANQFIYESFREGSLDRRKFSIVDAWDQTIGRIELEHAKKMGFNWQRISEAVGPLTTANFQGVVQQFGFTNFMDAYDSPDFPFKQLIPMKPTKLVAGERCPKYTEVIPTDGPGGDIRPEGEAFKWAEMRADFIQTPPVEDIGRMLGLTEEMVTADQVGDLADMNAKMGRYVGWQVEERGIDCIIDLNRTAHRHNRKGLGPVHSYDDDQGLVAQDGGQGLHNFDNLSTNALANYSDLNELEQLFNQIVDPDTGRPIDIVPKHLIYPKALQNTVDAILRAGLLLKGDYTEASPNDVQTRYDNTYANRYQPVTSKFFRQRTNSDIIWYLGDITRYAKRMELFPIQVIEAPALNPDHFARRIVLAWRAATAFAYVVWEPRAMCKSTGAS